MICTLINKEMIFKITSGTVSKIYFSTALDSAENEDVYNIILGEEIFNPASFYSEIETKKLPSPKTFLFSFFTYCLHMKEGIQEESSLKESQAITRQLFVGTNDAGILAVKLFGNKEAEIPEKEFTPEIFNDFDTYLRFGLISAKYKGKEYVYFDEINESVFLRQSTGTMLSPAPSTLSAGIRNSRPVPLNFNLTAFLTGF